MNTDSVTPKNETRVPSTQTMADIFEGGWKSAIPSVSTSGEVPMFSDSRIEWLSGRCLGGSLHGKSVLEAGPFEGYQSFLLKSSGVRELVSVEANSFNFLKCLIVRQIFNMDVDYQLGDILKYLEAGRKKFDLVVASGILYHLQDPEKFLTLCGETADELYIWTHYWDDRIPALINGQEQHFVPGLDKVVSCCGKNINLHARSYLINDYQANLPKYWEGGLKDITFWMEKDDILSLLEASGYGVVEIQADTELNGLPVLSCYASKHARAGL